MVQRQATGKKRADSPNKPITSELPAVKCKRLNCRSLLFNWKINGLSGSPENQKNVLMQKIREMPIDEQASAAIGLLDVHGNSSFLSAALLAIKELKVPASLGTIANKAFSGRTYEECRKILEGANLSFDEKALDLLKQSCEKKDTPIGLYQVSI